MRLSPDGAYLAFRAADAEGRELLRLLNLQTREVRTNGIGEKGLGTISNLTWISTERLVVHLREDDRKWSAFAINRDGSEHTSLGGFPRVSLHARAPADMSGPPTQRSPPRPGERPPYILEPTVLYSNHANPPSIIGTVQTWLDLSESQGGLYYRSFGPHLARVNTSSGEATVIEPRVGLGVIWSLDSGGHARARIDFLPDGPVPKYRTAVDGEWTTLVPPGGDADECLPVGFHPDDGALLVATFSRERRHEIRRFEPTQNKYGPVVVADERHDVYDVGSPFFDEAPLTGPVRDLTSGTLAGWRYLAPEPVTVWFVSDLGATTSDLPRCLGH